MRAVPRLPRATPRAISEITRRDIFDSLTLELVDWAGRLEEPDFLARIYDLADMRSTDGRFKDAAGDIWQHRVNNPQDWEDDRVFTDSRFDLMQGGDETLLRFLAEMVHPAVRPDADEARALVESINKKLAADGWALVEVDHVSGRPICGGLRIRGAKQPATALKLPEYTRLQDPAVFHEHLRRIEAGLANDPAAAIASSKELVESVCMVVLDDYGVAYTSRDDLLDLYKAAARALELDAASVPGSAKGSQAAQGALRSLTTTVQRLAELRNELGLGHGRNQSSKALTRHARLAFNSASAIAEFMLDTWHSRRARDGNGSR
jgi:AbiJ N-terminal domain 3/Abortive infection C-terminus